MNEPDDAALVNKIGNPSPTVELLDRFVIIGYKRKPDAVLCRKFLMRFYTVTADTDNLCIPFFKFFQITLESNNFISSDRCEYGEIERQNDVLLSNKICQLNLPFRGITAK